MPGEFACCASHCRFSCVAALFVNVCQNKHFDEFYIKCGARATCGMKNYCVVAQETLK